MSIGRSASEKLRKLVSAKTNADRHMGLVPSFEDFCRNLAGNAEAAGAYEALLSSIELGAADGPCKTLLVTSTLPGEGKTTVAVNLSITIVLAGQKVLLVDGDLRRPSLHCIMGLENQIGFSDLLRGGCNINYAVQSVNIFGHGPDSRALSVMTSGAESRNATYALRSNARTILMSMGAEYDYVIVDSPPALSVNDPALFASAVDGILLVLGTGEVAESDARQAKDRLEHAGGRIVGLVLNRFDNSIHGSGFHLYGGYNDRGQS